MTMVTRAGWDAAEPDLDRMAVRNMDVVTLAVVHYNDSLPKSKRGKGEKSDDDWADVVRSIQRFHQETRGWADVAYHRLIAPGGTVFEGRKLQWVGAHCEGHNTESVGYCFLTDGADPTDAQLRAGRLQMETDRAPAGAWYPSVKSHRDLRPTGCPGGSLADWVAAGCPAPNAPLPEPAPAPGPCSALAPGPPPKGRTMFRLGDRGPGVAQVQAMLSQRGFIPAGSLRKDNTWDGVFGDGTRQAVLALQAAEGLAKDGIVGRQVWCVLGVT